jgi:hypothetical protein
MHLLQCVLPACDGDSEREVEERVHARAGPGGRLRIRQVSLRPFDVEPVQRFEVASSELEHARADALCVQPLRDVVAEKARRAGEKDRVHVAVPAPLKPTRRLTA